VGIAAGVALAAALPALPYACGLGTVELLAGDVVSDSLVPRGGAIRVHQAMLAAPTDELLERFAAPPDRVTWWQARATRCYDLVREG
jgi:O-succinylbenzoate synthase